MKKQYIKGTKTVVGENFQGKGLTVVIRDQRTKPIATRTMGGGRRSQRSSQVR